MKTPLLKNAQTLSLYIHWGELWLNHPKIVFFNELAFNLKTHLFDHKEPEIVLASAYLHQALSNKKLTKDTLRTTFGDRIANIVSLLTRDPNEKKISYESRISSCGDEDVILISKTIEFTKAFFSGALNYSTNLTHNARLLASYLHWGQMYSNHPYLFFLDEVSFKLNNELIIKKHQYPEQVLSAGLLYLIFTKSTKVDLVDKDFLLSVFGERVFSLISILTRKHHEKYSTYISRIVESGDKDAILIKKCALSVRINLAKKTRHSLLNRYESALTILNKVHLTSL